MKDAAADRFEKGYVISSVPFGYTKVKTSNASKAPSVLRVNEAQASIVRRIFDLYIAGPGFKRIAVLLNNEGVATPVAGKAWAVSSIREILHREIYNGVVVSGKVARTGPDKSKDRTRMAKTEWKRRADETLRIVTPQQWATVQSRLASHDRAFLRRGDGKIVSKPEQTRGKHLLSGFMICGEPNPDCPRGICGAPLIAIRHGRNGRLAYACRDHREGRGCTNKSAVPYAEAHDAVISALRRTFSPESFEAHLANIANDAEARAHRDAERANLLVEIPKLAAAEAKLARLVATTDEVEALVAQLKLTQAERKAAEARVAELEGIELDIRASRDQVEKLKATWSEWSKLLAAHDAPLPDGTYGAPLARSVLRKVLLGPIVVTPVLADASSDLQKLCGGEPVTLVGWKFRGVSRFDAVISGGLAKGEVAVNAPWGSPDLLRCMGIDKDFNGFHPIAGGSDAGVPDGRGIEMAPQTPQRSSRPGKAVALLDYARSNGGPEMAPHTAVTSSRSPSGRAPGAAAPSVRTCRWRPRPSPRAARRGG